MVKVDFKCVGENRGVYFSDTERALIFLCNHESLDDIYKTIQHEVLHHAIEKTDELMDEEQQERIVFSMAWANEILV